MTTELFDARSMVTVISFITFIGIVWWAYSGRRKSAFDEAAWLPFADEDNADKAVDKAEGCNTEKRHG